MKRSAQLKRSYTGIIITVVLFLAVMVCFMVGLSKAESSSREQNLEAVKQSVENGVSLCYSIEGAYPESLDYLISGYGVSYNHDKYIVHYDCFASNVRPIITVIEKED